MSKQMHISRRAFLRLSGLSVATATIAACAPKAVEPTAAPAEPTRVAAETPVPPPPIETGFRGSLTLAMQYAEVVPGKPKEPGQIGWEAVVAGYKDVQPNVKIEETFLPTGDLAQMTDFIRTRQAAGDLPTLINHWVGPSNREEDEGKSPWVTTTPYLELVNPYSGNIWEDDFYEDIMQFQLGTRRYQYALAINKGQGIWVYNKTMFEERGWEPPAVDRYSEFQKLLADIKAEDIIPISEWGTAFSGFTDHPIRAYLNSLQRHQWSRVAGGPDVRWITSQQNLEGFYCGIFTYKDEGVQTAFELAKYLNKHAPPGHWSLDRQQTNELWYAEQAAITWQFSGFPLTYDRLVSEGQIEWEFETFRTPDFDRPVIGDLDAYPVQDLGERGRQWAIPAQGFRKNKDMEQQDMAADFLMFWTAPEMQGIFCGHTYSLPVNPRSSVGDPRLALWQKNPNGWYQQYRSDLDHNKWFQHWQAFVDDQVSYMEYAETMDRENVADAERLAREQELELSCDRF